MGKWLSRKTDMPGFYDAGRLMGLNFDDLLQDFFGSSIKPFSSGENFYPLIDVFDEKDRIMVKSEIPGMEKNDIKVSVEDQKLLIKGEKKEEKEEKRNGQIYQERSFGKFYRSLKLPAAVDSEKIKARYKDGILTVEIPKKEEKEKKEKEIVID